MPGDLTIFNMCTIYEDHMMYGSWDIMCDRVFYHFVLFFALLPPNNPQNQNFDKMKKNPWRYHHFTNTYHKLQSFDVWFLRYEVQQTELFVNFGHFLPFYPTNNPKNQNFEKMKKQPGDIIILHKCCKNHDDMLYCCS